MAALLLITLLLSLLFCGLYLRLALHWQLLDRPNQRSSHSVPTPHGGGLPLFAALAIGAALAGLWSGLGDAMYLLLLGVALLLVLVGALDDLLHLPVAVRLAIYSLCCFATAGLMLAQPLSALPTSLLVAAVVLAGVALNWGLNLYNFMDGIDGIAASQCVLACAGAAALAQWCGASDSYIIACLLLAAAQLGFLWWNRPPARLFMGDAGSVPTGFLLGALALLGAIRGELPAAVWLILLAPFISDASGTLLWRLRTRQRLTQAHSQHAYQRLSRHWNSHVAVLRLLVALHCLWLLPVAALALWWPQLQLFLVILAYIPLLVGMAKTARMA